MAACLHQRISGVDYLVTFPPGVGLCAADGIEAQFVVQQPAGRDCILVDVVAHETPDMSSWRPLVSQGPAWSIRQDGPQRCLCLGDPSKTALFGRVACWRDDTRRAIVYCGPEFLRGHGSDLEISNTAGYPVDQLLLMYYLASRHGLLVHAAGAVVDGRALIFPGVSGAGKSTLARQFLERGCSGLLSDDRMIVRQIGGDYQAFGTPWPGDAGVAVNAGAPLAAILFPAKSNANHISKLSPQDALSRLLPATSILWHEPELLTSQLATYEHLLGVIPAFELAWAIGSKVVDDVHEFARQL